jgi:hypothetical protein
VNHSALAPAGRSGSGVPAPAAAPTVALLPALLRGAVAVGVLAVGCAASGWLPSGSAPYLALGAGAALAATGLALVLHGRILDRRFAARLADDAHLIAGRLQGLLALGLLLKLATLCVAVLWLRAAGVKFDAVTTFAVSFAAASLVCQVTAAGCLLRAMSRRPGAADGKVGPAAGEPS